MGSVFSIASEDRKLVGYVDTDGVIYSAAAGSRCRIGYLTGGGFAYDVYDDRGSAAGPVASIRTGSTYGWDLFRQGSYRPEGYVRFDGAVYRAAGDDSADRRVGLTDARDAISRAGAAALLLILAS